MKEGYRPWISENKINWKKRMVYLFYQGAAIFRTHDTLVHKYEEQIRSIPESGCMYEQVGYNNSIYFERKWLETTKEASFEGELFQIPIGTDERLTGEYGDYMTPPPIEQQVSHHDQYFVDLTKRFSVKEIYGLKLKKQEKKVYKYE